MLYKLTDGTSNTLMFGESQGGLSNGQTIYIYPWIGSCVIETRFGLPASGGNSDWRQFSSPHTSAVLFAFCDGSVRPLKAGGSNNFTPPATGPGAYAYTFPAVPPQEWTVLQQLAGIRDGSAGDSSILP